MTDIFREVEEDLRSERYQKLWNRYGRFVIGAAVGIVVVTALWQAWAGWERSKNETAGERFIAATQILQRGQAGMAITLLEALEADAHAGYATMARLQRASALITAGDRREAISLYDQVSADTSVDKPIRDLAALLAAQNLLDTADRPTLERRLAPLNNEANPWRFSAREMLALTALKANDVPKTRELFTALADDQAAPQGVRARAAEMLAALGA
ncbi:MAG: tetratricopeptide repeat protein [Alphaproteobacteria bacterium]|nr:tetratricopeptide repeat protein [Alphaproteobacteria bacterium]